MLNQGKNASEVISEARSLIEMSMESPIVVLPNSLRALPNEGQLIGPLFLNLRRLDPSTVKPGEFNNRLEHNFDGVEFLSLKEQIRQSNGNIQPIKVRDVGLNQYEIVFGHRRYRACLELNIPVLAIVENLDDRDLWLQMDQENREQKRLSMYEQGAFYSQAISQGFYKNQRDLATNIGLSFSYVAKCIRVYELPHEIICIFKSPLQITGAIAEKISEALKVDSKIIIQRAKEIGLNNQLSISEVISQLLGKSSDANEIVTVLKNDKQMATIKQRQGKFEIVSDIVTMADIQKMLQNFFN